MDTTIPLVVSQVNPDDLEGHQGIIANPNCSTMQLAPVLMAPARRRRPGPGRRGHVSVRLGHRRRRPGRARDADPGPRQRRAQGRLGLPAPDRVQRAARDRRLPAQRLHRRGVEGRDREPQDPGPARPADHLHRGPRPGLRQPLRGGHRRDPRPDHARAAHGPCSPPCRASSSRTTPPSTTTRWPRTPPVATRSSSAASGATCPSRTVAASPSGSSPTTCARARRRTPSSWPRRSASAAGSGPAADRGATPVRRARACRGDSVIDGERRTALEAIAAEVRVCTNCRLHETRTKAVPGEGDPDTEVVFVGEGPGFNEDRLGPAVRRSGRGPAGQAPRFDRLEARGRVHHQRRQVPAAGEPRPATRRDRGLRPVPAAPARGPRSGGRRDPRSLLDGRVHARRPDLVGARDGPSGGSRDRCAPTPWPSRCTIRRPLCGRRPSNARATPISRRSRRPSIELPGATCRQPRRLRRRPRSPRAAVPAPAAEAASRAEPPVSAAPPRRPSPRTVSDTRCLHRDHARRPTTPPHN